MMSIETTLQQRADAKCELCGADHSLSVFEVSPSDGSADQCVLICETCRTQLDQPDTTDANHWRCLNDAMWKPVPAIQVVAYRQLKRLSDTGEAWAQDLLDMLYLEDDVKQWAEAGLANADDDSPVTKDCHGTVLAAGDTVTLIKDLDVKGANFTAKRGTAVRGIALTDNPAHIEGKVNGVRIVILTQYVKKSS